MQQDPVCRGCLATDSKFSGLRDFHTAQAYESLLGIPLRLPDGFPEQLCSFCTRSVHKFTEFRLRCLKAMEVLHLARMEGRLVAREYVNSVRSNHPELRPRYTQTETYTSEILKQDEDDLLNSMGTFIALDIEKEDALSDTNHADIEPKLEYDDIKVMPYEIFVEDVNIRKRNNIRKKPKRKIRKSKVKEVKKLKKKTKKRKSDRDIVIDYARSAGFDITFLSQEEQIKEVETRKNEKVSSGHNCPQCGKHYDNANALERHKKNYHVLKPDFFMCDICSCVFKNKRTLRSHMVNHSWVFTCLTCSFKTKQRPVLRKHRQFHEGKKFSCKYCEKEFTKSTTYFTHVRLRHACELSWCDLCGEFFISAKGVENHKNLSHNMAEEFPSACRKCEKRFQSDEALERHAVVNGCGRPSCARCGDAFLDDEILKHHLVQRRECAAAERHECGRCRMRFHSASARARHECARAACAACGAACRDRRALLAHVRAAHDIFTCGQCGKRFSNSAYLRRHFALHSHANERAGRQCGQPGQYKKYPGGLTALRAWRVERERVAHERVAPDGRALRRDERDLPAMCELCGKKFRNMTQLKTHQQFHSTENQFSCSVCPKGFKQRAQLLMHERVHTGERPYKCPECPKAFKTYQAYTRHFLIHSGVRKHVCQQCGKSFQTSTAAKAHVTSVHLRMRAPRLRRRRGELLSQ
ncbi:zinc finger protein 497-like [Plodia interpunctella]|uniref:zinc finger protein 497-like n=1 Tax=Plodia interpunctella TaxID=58824 RepID=UPI002368135C|nr:zinc finger protein 497-like [Plodia interpunctella]XP_053622796.1 zinc finger protein 497-like [Plodia interpunctella]XP_053622797.1 zinc finger protein 497-like [Plodia interpunctella]XP_053622798.1 zinc finger protein 497-like [Plodia interpunctella]